MRILVIDDDPAIIRMFCDLLRDSHMVSGAVSADSAIELLQHDQYDIVFVDYDIPGHDGQWFMRNAHLPRHTVALLLTGCLTRKMLADMFKLGISGYLTKPLSIDDIQTNIEFYSHSGHYAEYSASA